MSLEKKAYEKENPLENFIENIKLNWKQLWKGQDSIVYLYEWKVYKFYKLWAETIRQYYYIQTKFYSFLKRVFWPQIQTINFQDPKNNIIPVSQNECIALLPYVQWKIFENREYFNEDLDIELEQLLEKLCNSKDKHQKYVWEYIKHWMKINFRQSNRMFFSLLFDSFLELEKYPLSWNTIWYTNVKKITFLENKKEKTWYFITDVSDWIATLMKNF